MPANPGYWVLFICNNCNQYKCLSSSKTGFLVLETIMYGNYFMIFFSEDKEANVVEIGPHDDINRRKVLKTFTLNELTHEFAVQWVKKLKLYVLYQ